MVTKKELKTCFLLKNRKNGFTSILINDFSGSCVAMGVFFKGSVSLRGVFFKGSVLQGSVL